MNGTPGRSTLERVAGEFALDAPVGAIEPFGTGLINDTFLVTSGTGGAYVLQRINRSVFGDPVSLMRNVAIVSLHLDGRFVPELVPAHHGGWIVADGDDTWRAWRRIADACTIHHPTPARVASAAHLVGRFHAAVADLAPSLLTETIPSFHNPSLRLAQLRDAVTADPVERAARVAAEIETAFAHAPLAELADDLGSRVPARVAHNDAQLANILFREDDAVCLVDLDTVMPTAWFWDVGDLLRTASTPAAEDDPDPEHQVADPALVHAILDGYRTGAASVLAPGSAEDEALRAAGLIVTYEQALRFLTDWILGDVYYRTSRAHQNLDRARAQLALLASLQATVAP